MKHLTLEQLQKKVFRQMDEVDHIVEAHRRRTASVYNVEFSEPEIVGRGRALVSDYWCPEHNCKESVLFYRDGEIINFDHEIRE